MTEKSFIKLFNRVDKNHKKNVISLFNHYFLLCNYEYNKTYPKLCMENLNNQVSNINISQSNEIYFYLFPLKCFLIS